MGWTDWSKVQGEGLEFTDLVYEKKYHREIEGGIARILVNRPEKYNAFTGHTMDEMFRAVYDASHDRRIGVAVLGGTGQHFGTGGDVEWEQWGLREQFYWRSAPNRVIRMCRKPVIAMVQGYCIGGSNHLAYCCDLTIASADSIFGQNGPRVASPADGYIMPYLVRVVGAKKAREMWMLSRRYTASEALDMNLVNTVVPRDRLEEEVDKWCEEMLALSPSCLEVLKASFDWEIDAMPSMGTMVNWLHHDFFETSEAREGSAAFLERRLPEFWKHRRADLGGNEEREDGPSGR